MFFCSIIMMIRFYLLSPLHLIILNISFFLCVVFIQISRNKTIAFSLPVSEGKLVSANIVSTAPLDVKTENDVATGQALAEKKHVGFLFIN